eukprot:GEMP01047509.1.p1 GENE.GEMP01047509.1~~GEMP01047509.1.p1  ORF type:complete len:248 (+),score=34.68 GEMP01047509.1:182-925(+)
MVQWPNCVLCDQPLVDVFIEECEKCKGRALYCGERCAKIDGNGNVHKEECRKLDMAEIYLHRVAKRSNHPEIVRLVFKDPYKAANELLNICSAENVSYCDAVFKWATFRNHLKLVEKSCGVKKRFGTTERRRPELAPLPKWSAVCEGVEEENERSLLNSTAKLKKSKKKKSRSKAADARSMPLKKLERQSVFSCKTAPADNVGRRGQVAAKRSVATRNGGSSDLTWYGTRSRERGKRGFSRSNSRRE